MNNTLIFFVIHTSTNQRRILVINIIPFLIYNVCFLFKKNEARVNVIITIQEAYIYFELYNISIRATNLVTITWIVIP